MHSKTRPLVYVLLLVAIGVPVATLACSADTPTAHGPPTLGSVDKGDPKSMGTAGSDGGPGAGPSIEHPKTNN